MSVLHAAQKTANKHLKSPHRYPVNPDRASIRLFFRRLLDDFRVARPVASMTVCAQEEDDIQEPLSMRDLIS